MLKNTWNSFTGLFRFTTDRTTKVVPLLTAEENLLMRQNLRLLIEQAKLALLAREQSIYDETLQQAQSWIQQHFEMAGGASKGMIEELEALSSVTVSPKLPNINRALDALKQFQSSEPQKAPESTPQTAPEQNEDQRRQRGTNFMKVFALFLVLLFGCLLLANIMVNDTGYVLIAYENITFESTLWGLCLIILLVAGAFWLVSGIIRMMFGATSFIYPFTARAKQRQARKLSIRGFAEFTHGHWKKAEKLLAQAAEAGETPLLTYLAAARAAHEAGNHDASADYLRRADHKAPGADLAIGITQAQIQLSAGQLEQALATIKRLHKKEPRHAFVLKLLKQVYHRLNDWQSLADLLPKLKKLKVIDDNEYRELELQSFEALFEQACNNGRGADVRR